MTKTKYPLYSGEICGTSYDAKGKQYKLIIITQWSSRAENATEVQRKAYYIESLSNIHGCMSAMLDNEDYCMQIFKYPQYSKLKIREEINIIPC